MQVSMLMGWWEKIVDMIIGILAFIPQTIYLLYASIASLLDVLQAIIRKLAGLDVYWVTNEAGERVQQSGDMLTSFLRGILGIEKNAQYSAINSVFWSMVIFGVIVLLLSTIFSIIKAHYNPDTNKASPTKILGGSFKSLATMAIVPIVTIFGVYLANVLLSAVDKVTSSASTSIMVNTFESGAISKFKAGETSTGDLSYASFDYFSAGDYTNNSSFSGMIFKVAAHDCNRVRRDDYQIISSQTMEDLIWENFGIFYSTKGTDAQKREAIAEQIDFAFANNLRLKESQNVFLSHRDDSWVGTSYQFISSIYAGGLRNVTSFSKYNVGLVFYFYDLWGFNWLLGFVGIIIVAAMLGNIVFGLMVRLLQVVALFLVFPALVGIMPLDEGQGFNAWRKQFIGDIVMAFGAVVGMNIFFVILPFFNSITFFGNSLVDGIVNMIIIMAGLTVIKKFISIISKFIGGSDANEIGQSTRSEVTSAAMKGVTGTMKAGGVGLALLKPALGGVAQGVKAAGSKIQDAKLKKTLGEDKKHQLTRKDYERANRLNTLSKKERKEILANAETLGTAEEKQKYLDSQLGLTGVDYVQDANGEWKLQTDGTASEADTNASRDKFHEHQDNTVKQLNKKIGVGRQIARWGLGQNPDDMKDAKLVEKKDEDGNGTGEYEIQRGSSPMQGVGNALLDLGDVTFKAFSQLTGASALYKQLADAGAVDAAKKNLQGLVKSIGGDPSDPAFNNRFGKLETAKDKEKREDKAAEQTRHAIESSIEIQKQQLEAIQQLINEIKTK